VQTRYIASDTDRQWNDHIPDSDEKTSLTWDLYMERTYGQQAGIIASYNSCACTSNC